MAVAKATVALVEAAGAAGATVAACPAGAGAPAANPPVRWAGSVAAAVVAAAAWEPA